MNVALSLVSVTPPGPAALDFDCLVFSYFQFLLLLPLWLLESS